MATHSPVADRLGAVSTASQGAARRAKQDLTTIRDAVRREGQLDDSGAVVVPADFFDRLNAQLNPPRQGPSLIDQIIAACDAKEGR